MNTLKISFKKELILNKLRILNALRFYDDSIDKIKTYDIQLYKLLYNSEDKRILKSFLQDRLKKTNRRLRLYSIANNLHYRKIMSIMILYTLIVVLRYLGGILSKNPYDLLVIYILEIFFGISFIITPTEIMTINLLAYRNELEELINNDKEQCRILEDMFKGLKTNALVKINLNRSELAAILSTNIENGIIELNNISRRRFCLILEKYCCLSESKEIIKLDKIISEFISDEGRNSNCAYTSCLEKLSQTIK